MELLENEKFPSSRIVGGYIRDSLLGIANSETDVDIATPIPINLVAEQLSNYNVFTVPTGMKFGTITAIIDNQKFEITTLRKDIHCDGRHTQVEFADKFDVDAARRDFTINALSYCVKEKKLYDYFDGLNHLQEKKVIFIGDATQRILEDHLRILRFLRFSSYYAISLDQVGYNACCSNKHLIQHLSRERINQEMKKIIVSPQANNILKQMIIDQIMSYVLPNLIINVDLLNQNHVNNSLDYLTIYSLLLHKNKSLYSALKKLKFSKNESRIVSQYVDFIHSVNANNIEFMLKKYWVDGVSNIEQLLLISKLIMVINDTQYRELLDYFDAIKIPKFPINGASLMKKGYFGRDIKDQMNKLRDIWIESDFKLSKKELLNYLK